MSGGERLQPSVIFTVTFVIIGAFMVTSMASLFNANAQANHDITKGWDVIGGVNTISWRTAPGAGSGTSLNLTGHNVEEYSNVTIASVLVSTPAHGDWWYVMNPDWNYQSGVSIDFVVHSSFYDPSAINPLNHRVDVWIVKNNTEWTTYRGSDPSPWVAWKGYKDFAFIREYRFSGAWFNRPDTDYYAIVPLGMLYQTSQNGLGSYSFYAKSNLTLWAKYTTTPGNLYYDMRSNHFMLAVGSVFGDTLTAHTSMWTMLGQLLTMQLPDVNPTANFLMAVPFWICISFVAITIVSRFLPFVGGG